MTKIVRAYKEETDRWIYFNITVSATSWKLRCPYKTYKGSEGSFDLNKAACDKKFDEIINEWHLIKVTEENQ